MHAYMQTYEIIHTCILAECQCTTCMTLHDSTWHHMAHDTHAAPRSPRRRSHLERVALRTGSSSTTTAGRTGGGRRPSEVGDPGAYDPHAGGTLAALHEQREVARARRDEDNGANGRCQLVGPVDVDGHRGGRIVAVAGVRD